MSDSLKGPVSGGGKGLTMAKKKKKAVVVLPKKTYWHLYSLQNLNSEKFIQVVSKVLQKEYQLIK